MGVGVFVRPGKVIEKGQMIGAYMGEVLKKSDEVIARSIYVFDLEGTNRGSKSMEVIVDGQTHGGWTRFCNSHCKPNVEVYPEQVGKIVLLVFKTAKRITSGSQIFINYGRAYFEDGETMCLCSAKRQPHLPPGDEQVKETKETKATKRARRT
ncbi:hypothetical protein B0T25DRAFT_459552 [Lasiosphaeria hispida]|uniref:SET domain-containing protein n=1 Tax=Lasiosphaeria hispida TaxID=260671 RepID=A0AAJ0HDQ9_9PEZI|nr:hypothetical protein B0T25DRAFT_459552 [Lasiosphaeria hispida]